jgi:hypothetical protein
LILYYYIKERIIYFFPLTIFSKCIAFQFIHIWCVFTEMKCTKQSVIGVHPCSFTGNEIYKTKLPLFASKEEHVGEKHYLFLHKDFDRSKKLFQFTFNGQNFFFLANTLILYAIYSKIDIVAFLLCFLRVFQITVHQIT